MGVWREGGGDSSSTKRKGICKRARSGFIVSGAHRATRSSLFRQKFHFLCVSSRHGFANWQNGHTRRAKLKKRRGQKKKKKQKNLVESGKEGKKKTFLVSCPPKTANTRKDIYLFINWETGIGPSFAALDFIFLCALCSHLPTTQKATTPFALTHEDITCNHFRPKKKKTIWDGKLYGTLAPPGAMAFRSLFGSAKVLGFNWLGWLNWLAYLPIGVLPLGLGKFLYFTGLVPCQFCVLQLISFSSFITNQPKKEKKIHF